MNIYYCDDCGSVTEQNHGPENGGMVCRRCSGAQEPQTQPKSGLDLLDEPPSSLQDANLGEGPSLDSGELDLFSSQTIARRREKPKPRTETTLRLVEEKPEEVATEDSQETQTPSPAVVATPPPMAQQPAERWCIDCLSCDGSLSIQPVGQKSRLRCPRCQATMVIEASGQVSLPAAAPQSPQQIAHFDAARPSPAPAEDRDGSPAVQEQGHNPVDEDSIPAPTTFEEIFSSFEAPLEPGSSSPETQVPSPAAENSSLKSSATTLTVDPKCGIDDSVVEEALLDEPLLDEELFAHPASQESTPDSLDQGLADALLGSSFDDLNEPSGHPVEAPASNVTIAFWVTLAALPALTAVLLSHQELAAASSALCQEIGASVEENTHRFLNWLTALLVQ